MIPPETPCDRVVRLRQELRDLMPTDRHDKQAGRAIMNVSFALRRAQQEWYDHEVHGWCQLPLTEVLHHRWDAITDWCSDNLDERDWLIFLPKGEQKTLYFRHPTAAVMLKLTFG